MARGIAARPLAGITAIALSLINGSTMVVGAWAIGWTTEHFVLASFSAGRLLVGAGATAAVAILGVSLLRMSTIVFRGILTGVVQFGAQADSRKRLAARYLALSPGWHRRQQTGALMSIAVSDVEYTWQAMNLFPFACGMVFMLVVAGWRVLAVDPALAAIAFVLIPVVLAANLVYQRLLVPRARAAQEERAAMSDFVHEAVAGRQVIRTAGLEQTFEADFAERASGLRRANTRIGAVSAVFEPLIELLPSVAMLGVLAVGTVRLRAGAIGIAEIVEFVYLLQTMTIPLNIISRFLSQLPLTRAGAGRILPVLESPETTVHGSATLPPGPHAVTLEGVVVRYGGIVGLDVPLLQIAAGERIAVAGAIGSGKTTLCRLLVRAAEADEGTVRIDGIDVRSLAEGELGHGTGFVSQEPVILPGTVRQTIELDDGADPERVERALRTAVADRFVAEGGGAERTVSSDTLSGGQRQRLAIARALGRRPGLLVLDDPTSALDATTEHELARRLDEHRRTSGATVVTATNRLRLLHDADRVILLDAGAVIADGPHEELVSTVAAYRELLAAEGGENG